MCYTSCTRCDFNCHFFYYFNSFNFCMRNCKSLTLVSFWLHSRMINAFRHVTRSFMSEKYNFLLYTSNDRKFMQVCKRLSTSYIFRIFI